ncbi:MAG: hypothetical protein KJ787_06905 [Gammaproteobacteria bacterium]|nr:hypothetical protein [Gammaproteobacteria bacterium]MBU1646047.1 hypothetical protein [Gammaproteobacteria bacterium]MBU1972109.1 hypothetical protein [Gammaproteobacteria bacterium]
MSETTEGQQDRRSNPRLRIVFVEAYDVLEPFFDPANQWGGQSLEHLAYRALRERFPGLTGDDILTLLAAARRVFAGDGKPAP